MAKKEPEKADRVTLQPRTFYDGAPVSGWPHNPELAVGRVLSIGKIHGIRTARVLWPTGRKSWESLDRLEIVGKA